MNHPADETRKDLFIHGWLPAVLASVILAVSMAVDFHSPGNHWTQRAGSLVTVLGAYAAYADLMRSTKVIDDNLYINPELPYRVISIALVVVGTVVWGYGDLVL